MRNCEPEEANSDCTYMYLRLKRLIGMRIGVTKQHTGRSPPYDSNRCDNDDEQHG